MQLIFSNILAILCDRQKTSKYLEEMEIPDKKAMCALIVKNCQFNNEKYFNIQYMCDILQFCERKKT